jgi:hypothetical protein
VPDRSRRRPADLIRLAAATVGEVRCGDRDPHEGENPAAVELAERARGIGSGLAKRISSDAITGRS